MVGRIDYENCLGMERAHISCPPIRYRHQAFVVNAFVNYCRNSQSSLVQEIVQASDKTHPDSGTLAAQETFKAARGPTILIKVLL